MLGLVYFPATDLLQGRWPTLKLFKGLLHWMSDEEECGSVFPCLARMWGEKWWCVFFPITPCAETTRTSRLPHRRAPTYSHALSVSPLDAPSWFLSLWQQLNERAKIPCVSPFSFFFNLRDWRISSAFKACCWLACRLQGKSFFFFFSLSPCTVGVTVIKSCCVLLNCKRWEATKQKALYNVEKQ